MTGTSGKPRALELAPAAVLVERRTDGALFLRSPRRLGAYPPSPARWLDHWARAAPTRALAAHDDARPGSSTRVRRLLLLAEPPSIDGDEVTDEGYINQRAVLENRGSLVEGLCAEPPGAGVIEVP